MSNRYFNESPILGDSVLLAGSEAHHLAHVMRTRVGESVVLFDGSGWEFAAEVRRIGKQDVDLSIVAREQVDRELPLAIHLGAALPKGDRQAWLVEKTVELGVASLTPLRTERGVAQPVEKSLMRLRRGVIEASKQCGRNRLMRIDEPLSWTDFLGADDVASPRWVAHPGGQPAAALVQPLASSRRPIDRVRLAIGPEGGLTEGEIRQAHEAGWQLIDLGPRILRVETAAVFLTALVGLGCSTVDRGLPSANA